jgi:hypothetical protein
MRASAAARTALAFAACCAFFATFFAPVYGRHAFVGDPVDQLLETLPAYLGAHPLWEPRTMLGYPLGADPNQAYFYPLALLRALPGSFDAYEIAAYVLAAFGTFGLVRALARSTLGGAIGAPLFALGGFLIAQAGHVTIVEPAAWVPFVFWSLVGLRERGRAAPAAAGCVAATALAITAGQPQPVVDALFFAIPFACVVARGASDGARAYLARAAASLALGIGCAAIALVPETQLFLASARAGFGFERFQEFAVPVLQEPVRLFFPYAFGRSGVAPYAHSGFDLGSFAEMSDYAGIAGIALAIVAVRRERGDPIVRYWIAAAVAALLLATGNQLGLGFVTYHVPLYGLFRAPGRIAAELDLAVAVLAGYGTAALANGRASARDALRACGVTALAMTCAYLLFAGLSFMPPAIMQVVISGWARLDADPLANAAIAVPFITLACVAAAVVWFARAPARPERAAVLFAVVLADMLGFAWFAYWRTDAFGAERLAPPPYAAALRERLAAEHQRVVSVPLPGVDDGGIGPNLNLLWNVPSLRGYTPLQLARTRAFFDSDWGVPVWPLAARDDRTLDLGAVRYVIVVESPQTEAEHASVDDVSLFLREGARWRFVARYGSDNILENERALPRAWVVPRALPAAGRDVSAEMRAASFDPRATAYVDGLARPVASRAAPGDGAAIRELANERMRVAVRCAAPCMLVTSDTTYPGWHADVDGAPAAIRPADVALRGVAVPAGRHVVTFVYDGAIDALGRAASAGALVVALGFTLALHARRTRSAARRMRPA